MYKYFLDCTKEKARSDTLAGKEKGAFKTYQAIFHKHLNISDERRLDVESCVFYRRRAKSEKDVTAALQVRRQYQPWLVEAGFDHMYNPSQGHRPHGYDDPLEDDAQRGR